MAEAVVDVLASGAVCLGSGVVCDGFAEGFPFRVQTHIHEDHMGDFNRSKGFQDIYMSAETYALLVAEHDADLEFRDNLHPAGRGDERALDDGSMLSLLPSNHMLGASQVALELSDGLRLGYSGDFGWPLDEVIQVDELVVDSTYGSPRSIRRYTQAEAEASLLDLVCERLRHGSVHVNAHRGTIERVLHVLGGNVGVPILATDRLIREVRVYQAHGFAIGDLEAVGSDAGRAAMKERSYVRLYSKGDGFGNEPVGGTSITCSAYMAKSDNPLMAYSEWAYRVALSNHADFHETLAYVEATGAKRVITDNTRNHGWELAIAINNRLPGVTAEPSTNKPGPRWD
jgi:putative mRNA 3-end processing factor